VPGPTGGASSDPPEEESGSITRWIGDMKAGQERAVQPLWDRYYSTLVERARAKLRALRSPAAVNDEEDLALSAFQTLCQGVREGRFPRLNDRDDLWRLLVHLTACKAVDRHRSEFRQKRGGRKVLRQADMAAGEDEADALDRIIGPEPTPEFAAMVAEEYVRRLEALGDETLRRIAEQKLACFSNEEIARELGCSLRTVTLKLRLIRKLWDDER
jgi:DNA-directed RNA polymerase specialized sigma24 family protein